ncbi:MAG: hypothetical protein J6A22_03165 [Bacteroidales bacterium]|nr:hypothetical protein [Bacteroidales bacterium]
MHRNIILIILAVLFSASCVQTPPVEFGVETDDFVIGPEGGKLSMKLNSSDRWYATTEAPWITVSPANGRGSVDCTIIVDSTLTYSNREAVVFITNQDDPSKDTQLTVTQSGFPFLINLEDEEEEISDFAPKDDREFDVMVSANVEYDVVIPDDVKWLRVKKQPDFKPERGSRPRNSIISFEWDINSIDTDGRTAEIEFLAKNSNETLEKPTKLKVNQKAAVAIPENTPAGDSLSLIAISRALGCYMEWDTAEKMEHWRNVEVYKSGPNKGRVRYVQFFMFRTEEGIPFHVKYLTAAEELVFYSNTNTFLLKELDCGEYICELTNLKRLTIGAYGISSLPESFSNLRNLRYLDLSGNNFQTVPSVLKEENFPDLTALIFNSCTRYAVYDLSNDNRTNIGGFVEEPEFPKHLLRWNKLDTLRLSVNYIQGELPEMLDAPKWTAEDVGPLMDPKDTLPESLIGYPKVLPDTDLFAINFNRLTGNIPDWILYHPKLDLWFPFSLVFQQEGKNRKGEKAGFVNEPVSLDYYYDFYPNKKYNPNKVSK